MITRVIFISKQWLLLCVSFLIGCSPPNYEIEIWNKTGYELNQVNVTGDGFRSSAGVLIPNAFKVSSGQLGKLPDKLEISWVDHEGEHSVQIDRQEYLPGNYNDLVISFYINTDEVVDIKYNKRELKDYGSK